MGDYVSTGGYVILGAALVPLWMVVATTVLGITSANARLRLWGIQKQFENLHVMITPSESKVTKGIEEDKSDVIEGGQDKIIDSSSGNENMPLKDTSAISILRQEVQDVTTDSQKTKTPENRKVTGDRAYMITQLNTLHWKKIHVSIDAFNSHAAIVQRKPFGSSGKDIMLYLVKEVLDQELLKVVDE